MAGVASSDSVSANYVTQNQLLKSLREERLARSTPKTCTLHVCGVDLVVREHIGAEIGTMLWPGALALCEILDSKFFGGHYHSFEDESVLGDPYLVGSAIDFVEIGAGVGLCGIWMAKKLEQCYKACPRTAESPWEKLPRVLLTDQLKILANLRANVELNFATPLQVDPQIENIRIGKPPEVLVQELSWGSTGKDACFRILEDKQERGLVVFGSECVYDPVATSLLIETINELALFHKTHSTRPVQIFLSFGKERREAEIVFFRGFGISLTTVVTTGETDDSFKKELPHNPWRFQCLFCGKGGPATSFGEQLADVPVAWAAAEYPKILLMESSIDLDR